jgi:radical SAM superfamily enzyme YgiQ (UPF0313 family)
MSEDVLLIFPKTGLDLEKVNIQMPMGLMCIAAPLVKQGYKVTILDQRTDVNFFCKVKQYLEKKPICAGISTMTGLQILYALEIANFIRKNSQIPIAWGGIHPTLTADQTINNKNVDILVRGEGDITFLELVEALCFKRSLKELKGISWKDGKTVQHNQEREFCDLNKLSAVPYDLVDIEKYIIPQVPGRKRSLDIYTSRGCPHNCIFCYNQSYNKSTYRKKDIDIVIQETERLAKKYKLDSFYINDDNFFADIERSHYFFSSLIKKKIVPEWGCQGVRIDSLERIDFGLLEDSCCKHLYIGIESGSERILRLIKKQITIKQIKKIINKFAKSKMIAHYNFMVGYPTEDKDELFKTIELVDYIMKTDPKAYFSSFHLITPYPGTEFYKIVQQYGFKAPTTLEEWADVRWEFENASWVDHRMKKVDLNLTLLTYFIDRKGLDKIGNNLLLMTITKILMFFAKFHWKYKLFRFCPEFRLLHRLINNKINAEIAKIRMI